MIALQHRGGSRCAGAPYDSPCVVTRGTDFVSCPQSAAAAAVALAFVMGTFYRPFSPLQSREGSRNVPYVSVQSATAVCINY